MPKSWFDEENVIAGLRRTLNEEMMLTAEPIIQKAVVDAEQEMRKRLGAMLIAHIEHSFSIERLGNDLRITIKQAPRNPGGK